MAGQLDGIEPPERAEAALEKLVSGTKAQAERLEQLAGQADLTVAEMADAVEGGETLGPIRELAEGGYVKAPGHC